MWKYLCHMSIGLNPVISTRQFLSLSRDDFLHNIIHCPRLLIAESTYQLPDGFSIIYHSQKKRVTGCTVEWSINQVQLTVCYTLQETLMICLSWLCGTQRIQCLASTRRANRRWKLVWWGRWKDNVIQA